MSTLFPGAVMSDKRSLVMNGLRPVYTSDMATTNTSSIVLTPRVRKALCQLSVAIADHGYLSVDGGKHVVDFLLKNIEKGTPKEMEVVCDCLFVMSTISYRFLQVSPHRPLY